MKKYLYFLFFISLFIISCQKSDLPSLSQDKVEALQKEFKKNIQHRLSHSLFDNVKVGISIVSVDGRDILYQQIEKTPFITASAFKVIPSAIALIKLGPEYQFKTPLYYTGDINNGILKGDLYIQGKGDPSLTLSKIKRSVKELKSKGINRIDGNIYYDISFLDKERNRYAPNARNLYAPPSALTVNYNWIDVKIKEKPKPVLTLSPQTSYAQLTYDVTVNNNSSPGRPDMTYIKYEWGDHFSIKGEITAWDKQYHYVHLGVSRPGLFAATLLKEMCHKNNIKVTGKIAERKVPYNAKLLINIISLPLKHAVKVMNQESNNVIAETLNKDLGAIFNSVPGTRKKGIKVLEDYCVNKIKLKKGEFSIGDASGLSVNNKFSVFDFTKALNHFYKDKKIREALLPTLARQGHHPHARNPVPPDDILILVKTGTLSVRGVNTVIGYIIIKSTGDAFSFAVLANRDAPGPMTYSGTLTNPILVTIVNTLKKVYKID